MFSYSVPFCYFSFILLAIIFPLFIPERYKNYVFGFLSLITLVLMSIVVYAAYSGSGDWQEGTLIMDALILLPIIGMISYSLKILHTHIRNQTILKKVIIWSGVIVLLVLLYFLHGFFLERILLMYQA
jgi:uncharacterized protein YqhQ